MSYLVPLLTTLPRNLHHISHWEIALAHLSLWDLDASLKYWELLEAEATWSKAIYSYGLAVCLLESADALEAQVKEEGGTTAASKEEPSVRRERAMALMAKVPGLRQRIAGKSIPLEVSFENLSIVSEAEQPHRSLSLEKPADTLTIPATAPCFQLSSLPTCSSA